MAIIDFDVIKKSGELARLLEWEKWQNEIPYIEFPKEYLIRAIPPFHGSIIRYNIKHKEYNELWVSIYLDCYDILGLFGKPYWEVYPYDGDVFRCDMNDTEALLQAVKQSFEEQIKEL